MTKLRTFPICLALLALVACSAAPQPRAPEAEATAATSAVALDALVEEYFEEFLRLSPTFATDIGDYRYNDRLENSASPELAAARAALERRYLERMESIDPAGLDVSARITYDVFLDERKRTLEGLSFPGHLLPVNQLGSLASEFAVFGSGAGAHPFRNVKDYEDFLQRSRDFLAWTDQAIASMREGIRRGITQPRVTMEKVVPQLRAIVVERPEDSIFWHAVTALPESIPAGERERLTAAYRERIARDILPAYARLADFIEQVYLPAARTSVAWTALPDGARWYGYLVRASTTTGLGPDEIHAIGLQEVARIRAGMLAVKEQLGIPGDLHALFRHLEDPRFYFRSERELLEAYRALQARIDASLPRLFADFPTARYEVRAVEAFRAVAAPGAFYEPPSADGSRPGIFYVNTHNLQAQPRYGMETLALHEAAPGHHFQVAIQQELTGLPRFRRFNYYAAYQEGWALYCESIGRELGLFTDPYQWYGRLSDEMLRAMRLVVDTGLHARGWTRERAIAYMRENSSLAGSDVVAEVDRYIVNPGQALSYKIGQLRISALRARAEAALGGRFDVKAFHSEVLRDGALPLGVLEAKLDRWIAAQL